MLLDGKMNAYTCALVLLCFLGGGSTCSRLILLHLQLFPMSAYTCALVLLCFLGGGSICFRLILLHLQLFPLLCGVDVSYETPPFRPVLRVLPCQFSLLQVVPGAIQPPPLWSSSPSFPWYLHRHHSLAYVFVFFSQYMTCPYHFNLLSCTFLDISPTFVVHLFVPTGVVKLKWRTPRLHCSTDIPALVVGCYGVE